MRGGIKVYRGTAPAARNYLDADRSRADDYYLAEGTGLARRFAALADGPVVELAPLTGDSYEAWVTGLDPDSGEPRGWLRGDASAMRFIEVVVNGPKSWSLAAELHRDIATAYETAQDKAADQIIGWLRQHATARVGPRGAQVAAGDYPDHAARQTRERYEAAAAVYNRARHELVTHAPVCGTGAAELIPELIHHLQTAERRVASVDQRVATLSRDPAITSHPDPQALLQNAEAAWTSDRGAAYRRAASAPHDPVRSTSHEPQPTPPVDHGPSIGR